MEIVKISVLILVVVIISSGLPAFSKEISLLVTFSCCTVVLLYTVKKIIPVIEYLKNTIQNMALTDMDIILKAVGIGFITQFVSDIAADCNNKTLANLMMFVGRVFIVMLSLPVIFRIFEILDLLT